MLEKHVFMDKPTQEEIGQILETNTFPLLCRIYKNNSKQGRHKITFFEEPVKGNKKLQEQKYCALVCPVLLMLIVFKGLYGI